LIWVAAIALLVLWYGDLEPLNFGVMVIGGYWLLMGTLMLSESPELSPRVQRTLPRTFAGRALLTWFNPGPGTGFVFSVTSGVVAVAGLAIFGSLVPVRRPPRTESLVFAMVIAGYLLGYLGIVRLIAMPLCLRFGRLLSIPVGTLIGVMMLAMMLPSIVTVLTTGSAAPRYTPIEAIDWAWTLVELFESSYSPSLALAVLVGGAIFAAINLLLLFREFDYRRISVPERVLEDERNEAGDERPETGDVDRG
jgi:hypothetical protein